LKPFDHINNSSLNILSFHLKSDIDCQWIEKGSPLGLVYFSEEAVKKWVACASAHLDECLVRALGGL